MPRLSSPYYAAAAARPPFSVRVRVRSAAAADYASERIRAMGWQKPAEVARRHLACRHVRAAILPPADICRLRAHCATAIKFVGMRIVYEEQEMRREQRCCQKIDVAGMQKLRFSDAAIACLVGC